MFDNSTYKQKFIGSIVVFVIFFMGCYKKVFKETIQAKLELNKVSETLLNNEDNTFRMMKIKKDLNQINLSIGANSNNVNLVQQSILNFISKFKVNVFSIEDTHQFPENDFIIYTNQLDVEGSYEDLITLLFELEKEFKTSRLSSVRFYTKKNYQKNTKLLHLNLIFQNYASNK